jgi:hypothetical protein
VEVEEIEWGDEDAEEVDPFEYEEDYWTDPDVHDWDNYALVYDWDFNFNDEFVKETVYCYK